MQACTPPRARLGFTNNKLLILVLGVVVLAGLFSIIFTQVNKEIKISDNGKKYAVSVFGGTVSDALNKAGIKLEDKDVVEPGLGTKLKEGMKINVTRAINVSIVADGQTTRVRTPVRTVEDVLKEQKVTLGSQDKVEPALNGKINAGDTIKVIRVSEKTLTENKSVAFKVERQPDNRRFRGITSVLRQGKNGVVLRTIKVTLEDGKEVKREVVGEKVVQNPVNKLVAYGTLNQKVVSRGDSIRFDRVIPMSATAYTYTGNNTASGVPPRPGVVAVDPRVIPMGTKLYVDGYGFATALDKGSAIKGNKIDLFFTTRAEAIKWGRRTVKVYVLK